MSIRRCLAAAVMLVVSVALPGCARTAESTKAASDDPPSRATIDVAPFEDWCEKWSVTLNSPDGQANVIVSSEPLDPSVDSKEYASVQGDLLEGEFPGYEELSFEASTAFGMSGFAREFQWTPEDGDQVRQLQLYAADDGIGYTATATTIVDSDDEHGEDAERIVRAAKAIPSAAGPTRDCS